MPPQNGNPYTLHDAMRLVLREHGGCLHASDLARLIAERKLYVRKDGYSAPASQLRWRASKYPAIFSWGDGAICLRTLD
jgi:antitoxin Phd